MSKVFDLLKEYGVFYVATVNNGLPAVRPFGAVMEYNGELYLATANFKDVYKQLKAEKMYSWQLLKPPAWIGSELPDVRKKFMNWLSRKKCWKPVLF